MPKFPLPPFATFEVKDFHIGGSTTTVLETGARWVAFGENAVQAASSLRAINDGGFIGSEGDKYRDLLNDQMPGHLDITGEAHSAVGEAINRYGQALTEALTQMGIVSGKGRVDHGLVQKAVAAYNAAEAAAIAARSNAMVAKAAAVAGAATPAGPALAMAAASAESAAVAAEGQREAADVHHGAMVANWESDLSAAQGVKDKLGVDVDGVVAVVQAQARKRFEENPTGLAGAWADVKAWVNDNAELLSNISDILQIIGGIMMLIPGLNLIGAVLLGIGIALKGLLALTGNASWGEFAFDLITSLPGGKLLKAAKLGKFGKAGAKVATGVSKVGDVSLSVAKAAAGKAALKAADGVAAVAGEKAAKAAYSKITRGGEICFAAEPVDMATGALVDFETDVAIAGVLPLVVDRNSNSGHQLGRALGPQWVSRMDCRIEICATEVLMLAPDGALITFPPAPLDGSEVRADGRPWLLSFAEGAYRVRDVAAGLVYVFATTGAGSLVRPVAPVADTRDLHDPGQPAVPEELVGVSVGGYGCPGASVAGHAGVGIEVGLSALVHRSGHHINYEYDPSTGLMVAMRRGDGTVLELVWDRRVSRLASIWLSHTDHEDQPQRLISYEYDPHGRLRRVVNSAAGALSYHYDEAGRIAGWTDRNGASYRYVFDDAGRVVTQVGTGGMFPNALVWLTDDAPDAPAGGSVCVLVETAGEFAGDPLVVGDGVIPGLLARIEELPLVKALRAGGLSAAGLTGCGRDGARSDQDWQVPQEWLSDEVLGQVRPTVYRSTLAGDVWRIVAPTGECVDYAHDEFHNIVETVGPDGAVTTRSVDEFGFVTGVRYPDGSQMVAEPAAWGVPARVIGPDGLSTEYEVDAAGCVTAVTGPDGQVTRFAYAWCAAGLVDAGWTDPAGVPTTVECDAAGRVVATTDAAGRRWSVVRDAAGRVIESMDPVGAVTRVEYSPEGWPWQVRYPDGSVVRATYDGEGNVVQTVNEIGAVTGTEYTVFDKPVVVTDAAGGVTRLVYNTQMEVVGLVNADGRRWGFEYDLSGRIVGEVDFNGLVTRFERDAASRWERVVDAAGGVSTTWRDVMGRVVQHTDSAGVDTTWSYDAAGRPTEVCGGQALVSYVWDQWGRLVSESTELATGEVCGVLPVRDGFGRSLGQEVVLAGGRVVRQTGVVDAATGEVTGMSVTQGTGDQGSSDQGAGGVGLGELAWLGLGCDGAGRRSQMVVGSLVREWGFDVRGRVSVDVLSRLDPTSHTTDTDAAGVLPVVAGRAWSWRADGAVSVVNDVLAGVARFDVDVLGRVTGVTRDTSMVTATGGSGDAAGTVGVVSTPEAYEFSAAGALVGVMAPELGGDVGVPVARSRRSVLEGPQARRDRVELSGTKVTRVGRTAYTYDELGRVVRTVTTRTSLKPLVKEFSYVGATGQVAGFVSSDVPGVRWVYAYDGLGRRVSKSCVDVVSGVTVSRTVFVYSGDVLVGECVTVGDATTDAATGVAGGVGGSGGVVGRVWVRDPGTGEVLGQVDYTDTAADAAGGSGVLGWSQDRVDAVFYALVADLAGAPRELVDPDTGCVVGRVSQTLFGRRSWRGVCSPLLFAGQYEDSESGWVYNRFRFYDPVSGVYGSQDPLGVGPNVGCPQGYVANPLTWVDALGLKAHQVTVKELQDLGVKNPKEVAAWLNQDRYPGTGLYRYGDAAAPEYAGISNDLPRREVQHGDRFTGPMQRYDVDPAGYSEGATYLSRNQNRAIEEATIDHFGMKKDGGNGILENTQHSVRPGRDIYEGAATWARDFANKYIDGLDFGQ